MSKQSIIKKEIKHTNTVFKQKPIEVGQKKFIDPITGEEVEFTLIRKNIKGDVGFWKVWMQDILNILESFGNKKISVLVYLLKKMRTEDNTVTATHDMIAKATSISRATISRAINELINADVLKKIAPATYQFNPAIIIKGTPNKRHYLMIEYNNIGETEPDRLYLDKNKQIYEIDKIYKEQNKIIDQQED